MRLSDFEIDVLMKCSAGFLSKEDVQNAIPDKVDYNTLLGLLMDSCKEKNNSLFEAILWWMPNKLVKNEEEKLFKLLLKERNHFQHENLATAFQMDFHSNISNIDELRNAINTIPDYLIPDDFKYPYIRKLIYAIGAQPEPYNIEALEKLANETEDEQIRELALHQIEKRKKLGRWEASMNDQ